MKQIHLKELDLNSTGLSANDMEKSVRELLNKCPNLQNINMRSCDNKMMTTKQIQSLLDDFPNRIKNHDLERAQTLDTQHKIKGALFNGSSEYDDNMIEKIMNAIKEAAITNNVEMSDRDEKSMTEFLSDGDIRENGPTEKELEGRLNALKSLSKSGVEQFMKVCKKNGGSSNNGGCVVM